ncbi:MAG: hypothetical protein NZL83_01625 [Candidatus Absconditabacterales bacterium]|nr:hypothetical protein [Candidatus Absconditabacterales bacterium]
MVLFQSKGPGEDHECMNERTKSIDGIFNYTKKYLFEGKSLSDFLDKLKESGFDDITSFKVHCASLLDYGKSRDNLFSKQMEEIDQSIADDIKSGKLEIKCESDKLFEKMTRMKESNIRSRDNYIHIGMNFDKQNREKLEAIFRYCDLVQKFSQNIGKALDS